MSVYDPFYTITKMTTLPPDPRARKRAAGRTFGSALLGLLLSMWTAQILVAAQLHFDRALGSIIFPPWNVASWYFTYANASFPSASFANHVHHVFQQAAIVFCAGIALTIVFAVIEYNRLKNDRSKLTTEKGDARWATPEEIAGLGPAQDAADDSLLPEGYDLYRGFNRKALARSGTMRGRAKSYARNKAAIAKQAAQDDDAS